MLESIRDGVKKPWVKIVIFAIVISFVFAGYFTSSFFLGDPNAVAVVNGESISRNEFQRAYSNVKANRADFYQANVKTEEDERNFQENVLQQLITVKVSEQAIYDMGMRLSNNALRKVIQSDQNFQVDGKYSTELVEQTLVRAGLSREGLKQIYANQETSRQLTSGLFQTNFALEGEARKEYELIAQRRSGRAIKVNFEAFKSDIEVTPEDIANYYQANQESFRVEEKVSIDYLELSVEKLQAEQTPTQEQIESYYQDNLNRFKSEDQRQYSHILILSNDDEEAALAKANAIAARLNQGEDFAAIAQTESDDVPTRESGGDLGVLLPGSLDEPSEEAVALLTQAGQTTPPVKLDFGYQILKLTNVIEGNVQPLEKVSAELLPELSKQMAEEAFYSKSELLKEKSFEFSDSLAEAAEATGLSVQTSALFGKNSRDGIFANQQIKDAAFSSDVLEGLLNSEPIEIDNNHLVVLRLKQHQPSEIQPIENVGERVRASLIQSKAREATEQVAASLLQKLKAAQEVTDDLAENDLRWIDLNKVERNNAVLSYGANSTFFKMPKPEQDQVSYDKAEDFQGITILMLNAVEKGDWSKAEELQKTQQNLYMANYFSNADYESYIEALRKQASVRRNLDNLAQ